VQEWNILHHELPNFKETIYAMLKDCNKKILIKVISDTEEESRGETAKFLKKLLDDIA
jgi:hypothetical protein